MKFFIVVALTILSSFSVHADDCASNLSELKTLIGNSALPMVWSENNANASRRLTLKLANEGSVLGLDLSIPSGNWAHVTGEICKTGPETFVAYVETMSWGPQAPRLVRFAGRPSQIKLQLLYPTLLKVTAKGMSFQFGPK